MKSALDSIMYGSSWSARDAKGRRFELYGPWHRAFSPEDRRDFPRRDFAAVRRRTHSRHSPAIDLLLFFIGAALIVYSVFGLFDVLLSRGLDGWWVSAICLVICLMIGGHLLVGIPADPSKFRRAMLAERRCPSCAHRLSSDSDYPEEPVLCTECGAAWRIERPVVPPPKKLEEGEWSTIDSRGVKHPLFNAPALGSMAAQQLELSKDELNRLRAESSKFSKRRRMAMALFPGIFLLQYGSRAIESLIGGSTWEAVFHTSLFVVCCLGLLATFRLSNGLNRDMFRAAMLRRGRCPRCAYRIEGCPPDPADDCRVCPECGAVWTLPEAPPTEQVGARSSSTSPSPHA